MLQGLFRATVTAEAAEGEGVLFVVLRFPTLALPTTTIPPLTPVRDVP